MSELEPFQLTAKTINTCLRELNEKAEAMNIAAKKPDSLNNDPTGAIRLILVQHCLPLGIVPYMIFHRALHFILNLNN